jgi:hypothetical protein
MSAKPDALIEILKDRFALHSSRQAGVKWIGVEARLAAAPPVKLKALAEVERTGGEPDEVGRESKALAFVDCVAESPAARRSLCFDRAALETGAAMGVTLLTEEKCRALQALAAFDRKTSSCIATRPEIRKLGGAVFCDRRYDTVFVYHNGAESCYAARDFIGRMVV